MLPPSVLALPTPAFPTPTAGFGGRPRGRSASRPRGNCDYRRLGPADVLPPIAELIGEGDLVPVAVRGWSQQAYVHPHARWPREVAARALKAPFDPLVLHRPRTERLFGFQYRLEIHTPAARRTRGYYVLPFLLGDTPVARVDLKADRAAATLLVHAAYAADGAPADCARELPGSRGSWRTGWAWSGSWREAGAIWHCRSRPRCTMAGPARPEAGPAGGPKRRAVSLPARPRPALPWARAPPRSSPTWR